MSIASQCSECCTCPTATVEWDSRSASLTKCGWVGQDGKTYASATLSGAIAFTIYNSTDGSCSGGDYASSTQTGSGESTVNKGTCLTGGNCTYTCSDTSSSSGIPPFTETLIYGFLQNNGCIDDDSEDWPSWTDGVTANTYTSTASSACFNPAFGGRDGKTNGGSFTLTLADEYTTAELKTNTVAALPAYDDDWNDTAGSFANLSTDEITYLIRESRYRLRFPIPKVNTGRNLRASWVERFIAEAGVAVTSVEVYARGVYRPTVTISTSPLGTNAAATAVMASDGTVASLSILNPGAGYIPLITFSGGGGTGAAAITIINSSGAVTGVTITSGGSGYTSAPTVAFTNVTAPRVRATGTAVVTGGVVTGINVGTAGDFRPTVTVQTATSGGTTSTGWIATLAVTGEVASIAGGNAGNYLPTLAFTGGGGSGATATCTVDSTGGIAAVTVTAGGSAYTSEPTLTITPKVTDSTAADLIIHMGTETAKCAVWDGTTLGGKWVLREVVDAGHALTSIEVVHGGTGFTSPPTVAITGGGGSGATATATVSGGVITGITLGAAGSGYKTNPTITLSGGGGAGGGTVLLAAHFGTETEYADNAQPAGTTPLGYVDGVVRTYPLIGSTGTAPWKYYELAVPATDGTTLVANLRTVCDGTACP